MLTTSQSMLAANWSPFCSRVVDALLLISIWRWEPEVLVLYRKREGARRLHEHGVFARFRYNDLKEAARDCGGRGPYAS